MCRSGRRWCIDEYGGAALPDGRQNAGRSCDGPGNRGTGRILLNSPYPRMRRRTSTDAQGPKPTDNRALFPHGPATDLQPLPEMQIARSAIKTVRRGEVRIPVQAEVLIPCPWRDNRALFPHGPATDLQPLPEMQIARSAIKTVRRGEVRIPVQAEVLIPCPWRDVEQM